MKEIRPSYYEGMWSSGYSFFYRAAYRARKDYQHSYSRYLERKNSHDDPSVPQRYVDTEFEEMIGKTIQGECSTLLYCCMAVESFLNNYGVRKFGEKFYKQNLERQGITEKLSNIILAISGKCIEPTDEIYKAARELFDNRNRLVHPKTKELTRANMESHVFDQEVQDPVVVDAYVDNMHRILQQFFTFDPSLQWDLEFRIIDESDM